MITVTKEAKSIKVGEQGAFVCNCRNPGKQPLVSIIVRTKDRAKLLREAITSVAQQSYRTIEVVLVNDGGSSPNLDELRAILGDINLTYVHHDTTRGRAEAANSGIQSAHGVFIGFLDDDDLLYPSHVEILVNYLKRSDLKIAYTDSLMIYQNYNPETGNIETTYTESLFSEDFDYSKLLFDNYIPFICLMFDRTVLVKAGGLDPSFELYEDHDLLIRIGESHPFYHIPKITAEYRQWFGAAQIAQNHSTSDLVKTSHINLIRKHLDKYTPERIFRYRHAMTAAKDAHIRNLEKLLHKKDMEIAGLRSLCDQQAQNIEELQNRVAGLDTLVKLREDQVARLEATVNEKEHCLQRLTAQLAGGQTGQ